MSTASRNKSISSTTTSTGSTANTSRKVHPEMASSSENIVPAPLQTPGHVPAFVAAPTEYPMVRALLLVSRKDHMPHHAHDLPIIVPIARFFSATRPPCPPA
jgi:hypothetical protein